jgi:hypothetical protein
MDFVFMDFCSHGYSSSADLCSSMVDKPRYVDSSTIVVLEAIATILSTIEFFAVAA